MTGKFNINNKKMWATGGVALAALGLAGAAGAQGVPTVTVNQQPLAFQGQPPVEQGGRVLVPLRGVLEKLGAYVEFDNRTQTVTAFRGATHITLQIGARSATVDNRAVGLDVPAQVINGSTLVPLRFVAESLGAQVSFDVSTNTVAIVTGGAAPVATTSPAPAAPPPVVQTPAPAPPTQPTRREDTVIGTVVAVYADLNPARLVVSVPGANGRAATDRTVTLSPNAVYTIQRPDQADTPIGINRLNPGQRVAVLQEGSGEAIAVNVLEAGARPRPAPPRPAPTTENRNNLPVSSVFKGEFLEYDKRDSTYVLKMTDGRTITVDSDVTILYDNQKINPDDLRSGDALTISVDPKTKRGTRIIVAVEK